jgi:2-oxoglutarate dehydrogenase E2 component (dihydrolipoamide succinyltransferase)
MDEHNLSAEDIVMGLKKITTKDVNTVLQQKSLISESEPKTMSREVHRENMSQLRKKLSHRLVAVKNETAMLTTFNEVDMSKIIQLRKKYQKNFTETHGIKLGFMSFFTKAVTEALLAFPKVNSMIDGDEIISHEYVDVAIAVTTDKGLMVPVLRNTEAMSLAEIEIQISELAVKARKFRLSIEEMSGGTFTITNGGIFGSMLSTPILNPPQAAILGMHNIVERPVAIDGKVEIRPIMYLALSYDHRLVDGRDSVSFLVRVKELLEEPYKMLLEGKDPEKVLLGL